MKIAVAEDTESQARAIEKGCRGFSCPSLLPLTRCDQHKVNVNLQARLGDGSKAPSASDLEVKQISDTQLLLLGHSLYTP